MSLRECYGTKQRNLSKGERFIAARLVTAQGFSRDRAREYVISANLTTQEVDLITRGRVPINVRGEKFYVGRPW